MTEKDLKNEAKKLFHSLLKTYEFVLSETKNNQLSYEQICKLYTKKLEKEKVKNSVPLVGYYYMSISSKIIKPSKVYNSMKKILDIYNVDVFDKDFLIKVAIDKDKLFELYFYDWIKKEFQDNKLSKNDNMIKQQNKELEK